jgi:hypothetical protein
MRWNFGDSRSTSLSLDEFLAQNKADGVEFFAGEEPWLVGLHKRNWQTFFRVIGCWRCSDGDRGITSAQIFSAYSILRASAWISDASKSCARCPACPTAKAGVSGGLEDQE